FSILQSWWQRTTHSELRKTALLSIASLRQDDAIQFLLTLLADGPAKDAQNALDALALYRRDGFLWQSVEEIWEIRKDVRLGK
ncbi:MAG: hypothetical protein VKL39_21405, partial [Leptolyngbyaceae bacterium]|nr:hypothetical protein [Leptolyngbyaceae bacterium]